MATDDPLRPESGELPRPDAFRSADLVRGTSDALTPAPYDNRSFPTLPDTGAEPAGPSFPPPAPPVPPHPGVGFAALWCIAFLSVTYGVLFGVLIVVIGAQAVLSGGWEAYLDRLRGIERSAAPPGGQPVRIPAALAQAFAPAILVAEAVSVGFALVVIRLVVGRAWRHRLALVRPSLNQLVLTVLSLPALVILPTGLYELFKKVVPPLLGDNAGVMQDLLSQWPIWFGVLAIGIGPGLGEELWCRGFLGRGLVARHGWVGGVLLTSLFFGLLHLDPSYVAVTACMGLWLHYVYLTGRSLWLPMLLHALNNSAAVVAAHLSEREAPGSQPEAIPWPIHVAAAALMAAVAFAMYRSRARLVPASGEAGPAWQPEFPGVECPPPGSGTRVFRPFWPGGLASALVAAALGLFALVIYLAATGRLAG